MFTFLPQEYKKEVIRDYRTRARALFMGLFLVLIIFSIALIMPTYVSLYFKKSAVLSEKKQAELIKDGTGSTEDGNDIDLMKSHLGIVELQSKEKTVVNMFEHILKQEYPGISITNISVLREGEGGRIEVRGISDTRQLLVDFSRILEGDSFFSKVDLPVSSLAKNKNIEFSLALDIKK